MNEEKVDEITSEIEYKKKEKEKNILKRVSPKAKFFLGLAIIAGGYFLLKGQGDMRIAVFIIGAAFFLLFFSQGDQGVRQLSEQELKMLLYSQLRKKQITQMGDHREIPEGKIKLQLQGRTKFLDRRPWRYECGFNIMKDSGIEDMYSAELDPFSGDLLGITFRPDGYSGTESPDIEVIRDPKLRDEIRYQRELGIKKYPNEGK